MTEPSVHISELIEPIVESMGFELVRVTYGGGRKPTLQIMAERPDGTMSVDDCARLSREISALLDVEDPLPGEFLLEVSSPGVDRPLTRPKDFERWLGFDTKIELGIAVEGRRRFRGKMTEFNGTDIVLVTDEGTVTLKYSEVSKAKLILTDDLLNAVQKAANENTGTA